MSVTVPVPCFCGGTNPECQKCAGSGQVEKPACQRCLGRGTIAGVMCMDCRGRKEAMVIISDDADVVGW